MVSENTKALARKMYRGLRKQGWKQSLRGKDKCSYRGRDGMKCAIGQIIPDSVAFSADRLEVSSIYVCVNDGVEGFEKFAEDLDFWKLCQHSHDANELPDAMRQTFNRIFDKHGIKIPH